MSRSGYYESDRDDPLAEGRFIAVWNKTRKGKRGQQFFRDLVAALDAMPVKELAAGSLQKRNDEGRVCALGALCSAKQIDVSDLLDYDDSGDDYGTVEAAARLDISETLARNVVWQNDECGYGKRVPIPNVLQGDWDGYKYKTLPETPAERWARIRTWAAKQIIETV